MEAISADLSESTSTSTPVSKRSRKVTAAAMPPDALPFLSADIVAKAASSLTNMRPVDKHDDLGVLVANTAREIAEKSVQLEMEFRQTIFSQVLQFHTRMMQLPGAPIVMILESAVANADDSEQTIVDNGNDVEA